MRFCAHGAEGVRHGRYALTIADYVKSVVDDIEEAGLGEIVIVAHSMAGLNQRRFMANKLYPESPHILAQDVSRREMPDDIPRTWH
jgi:hypothetical protein